MSEIIPITKATQNIKPPIKRSELIEALAIRELQKFRAEQSEIEAQIKATEKALYDKTLVDVIRAQGSVSVNRGEEPFSINCSYENNLRLASTIQITLTLTAPPEVKKLQRELSKLKNQRIVTEPSLYQLKLKISAAMSERSPAGDRVAALLKNPETSKALDETLEALKKPVQLAVTG